MVVKLDDATPPAGATCSEGERVDVFADRAVTFRALAARLRAEGCSEKAAFQLVVAREGARPPARVPFYFEVIGPGMPTSSDPIGTVQLKVWSRNDGRIEINSATPVTIAKTIDLPDTLPVWRVTYTFQPTDTVQHLAEIVEFVEKLHPSLPSSEPYAIFQRVPAERGVARRARQETIP